MSGAKKKAEAAKDPAEGKGSPTSKQGGMSLFGSLVHCARLSRLYYLFPFLCAQALQARMLVLASEATLRLQWRPRLRSRRAY